MNNFVFSGDGDLKLCDLGKTNEHLLGDSIDDHRQADSWAIGAIAYVLLGLDHWATTGVRERDKWADLRDGTATFDVPDDFPAISDAAVDFISSLLNHQDADSFPAGIMTHEFLSKAVDDGADGASANGGKGGYPLLLGSSASIGARVQSYAKASEIEQIVRACVAHTLENATLAPLKKRFEAMDTNGDGSISREEFSVAMRKEGYKPEPINAMFSALDKVGGRGGGGEGGGGRRGRNSVVVSRVMLGFVLSLLLCFRISCIDVFAQSLLSLY